MKIAIFTETFLPEINGVVTHIKVLKDGLEKLGHEVLIVTADGDVKHHFIENGILHCPAVRVKRFYNFGLAFPLSSSRLKLVSEFNPDIIHIHNEFGLGISGMRIARRLNKPMVYTLHTIYDDYIHYICPKPLIKLTKNISHKYVRYLTKKVNYITSPSGKGVDYLSHAGVKKLVRIIPNAAELDVFINSHTAPRDKLILENKYNIPHDATKICFVGRLGKEKNVDTLLNYWADTVKSEENLHLIIIGGGPELIALQKLAVKLNLENVTFTGAIEHKNLPPYLSLCDGYITTSLSDTNSISMLEAMAAGLPVFALSDPLNTGQVVEGVNGFIFTNADTMHEKLVKFINMDITKRNELKTKVVFSVSNSGSLELASNTLQVYKEALTNNNYSTIKQEIS